MGARNHKLPSRSPVVPSKIKIFLKCHGTRDKLLKIGTVPSKAGHLVTLGILLPNYIYLLLKSYLIDRYFTVKHDNELSIYLPIKSGVLEDSVPGPLL